mmetsp:Transcript_11268/g.69603  ORF Transcript_11268/g.69603 Transcript_11268/m.69603 type:complete len:222 (+) Transcript_11268:1865-2530(+)
MVQFSSEIFDKRVRLLFHPLYVLLLPDVLWMFERSSDDILFPNYLPETSKAKPAPLVACGLHGLFAQLVTCAAFAFAVRVHVQHCFPGVLVCASAVSTSSCKRSICCRMRAITSSFSWMARTYSSSSHCAFASTNSRLERSKCDTALDKRRSSARSASAGSSTPPSVLSDMANPLVTSTKRRRRWKCTETTPMQRTKQLEGKRWIDGCHSTDRRTSPTRDS